MPYKYSILSSHANAKPAKKRKASKKKASKPRKASKSY